MCDLSCPNLQRHYLALLETLLKFNRMYCVVNEIRMCEKMISIAKRFGELAAPVFWIIA
jgi:pilus assembly protein TadC